MADRYFARSASDNTDDWPYWFVADRTRGGLNVTGELASALDPTWPAGAVLTSRQGAESLAARANAVKGED